MKWILIALSFSIYANGKGYSGPSFSADAISLSIDHTITFKSLQSAVSECLKIVALPSTFGALISPNARFQQVAYDYKERGLNWGAVYGKYSIQFLEGNELTLNDEIAFTTDCSLFSKISQLSRQCYTESNFIRIIKEKDFFTFKLTHSDPYGSNEISKNYYLKNFLKFKFSKKVVNYNNNKNQQLDYSFHGLEIFIPSEYEPLYQIENDSMVMTNLIFPTQDLANCVIHNIK